MIWLHLLLGILATHRLSLLFSKESGPYRLFTRIRQIPPPKSNAHKGLQCLWCLSVHSSAVVTAYFWWLGWVEVEMLPVWWLAQSSGAICVNQAFTKG